MVKYERWFIEFPMSFGCWFRNKLKIIGIQVWEILHGMNHLIDTAWGRRAFFFPLSYMYFEKKDEN